MSDTEPARRYDFRMVPIEAIDSPGVKMRQSWDLDALQELAADIKAKGLRQPIGLRPTGDRYRVAYGDRRFMACGIAGERVIPALILPDDDVEEEQSKVAENWLREETNPADEALYFEQQLERTFGGDIERMCRELRLKESRINNRLDLLRGFEDVFEALQARSINLAVARELNKVKDGRFRSLFLKDAIAEGSTSGVVQARRMNLERMTMLESGEASAVAGAVGPSSEVPLNSMDRCLLCDSTADTHEMSYVRAHRSCIAVAQRAKQA